MPENIPEELQSAPLAYENPDFLNSHDGRMVRILSEYAEPLSRFRRERIQDTVVFFGSARFRACEEASHDLELLENTGSQQAAQQQLLLASDAWQAPEQCCPRLRYQGQHQLQEHPDRPNHCPRFDRRRIHHFRWRSTHHAAPRPKIRPHCSADDAAEA